MASGCVRLLHTYVQYYGIHKEFNSHCRHRSQFYSEIESEVVVSAHSISNDTSKEAVKILQFLHMARYARYCGVCVCVCVYICSCAPLHNFLHFTSTELVTD